MKEYDQIKGMLNKIRNLEKKTISNLREQVEQQLINNNTQSENNNSDINVINNVELEIHSDDSMDFNLSDEEKNNISQLVDEFRQEVSEIAELNKIDLYDNSCKFNGVITNLGLSFILSAGDDDGLYLNSTNMLKIDETSLDLINKLKVFQDKYKTVVTELIVNRKQN